MIRRILAWLRRKPEPDWWPRNWRLVGSDKDSIIVIEEWDTTDPRCPFVAVHSRTTQPDEHELGSA